MNSKKVFSKNLRAFMYIQNNRNSDVADAVGVSVQTVISWTKGRIFPGDENLDRLANYFHVPVGALFAEKVEI